MIRFIRGALRRSKRHNSRRIANLGVGMHVPFTYPSAEDRERTAEHYRNILIPDVVTKRAMQRRLGLDES
jgi:hypothetical protein